MNEELKPCPFCGATDAEPWTDDYDHDVVFCRHCGATGPQGTTQERAIKHWNKRTELNNYKEAIQAVCDKFETIIECNECPIQEYDVCPGQEGKNE